MSNDLPHPVPVPVPQPRRRDDGVLVAPILYPRFLRQVADALDALTAFEAEQDDHKEAAHYIGTGRFSLPLFDEELTNDDDLLEGLSGWLVQEDQACWVFVPYVPELENP